MIQELGKAATVYLRELSLYSLATLCFFHASTALLQVVLCLCKSSMTLPYEILSLQPSAIKLAIIVVDRPISCQNACQLSDLELALSLLSLRPSRQADVTPQEVWEISGSGKQPHIDYVLH